MRELIAYYAYNGKVFYDRNACITYENKALDLLAEICDAYDFLKEDGQKIQIPLNDIEEGLNAFKKLWKKCDVYVYVKKSVSHEAEELIWHYCGYTLLIEKGFYRYERKTFEWIKMDE